MTTAYLNRIATAVPEHEVHGTFIRFADRCLSDPRLQSLFKRIVSRAGIERRWSTLPPNLDPSAAMVDAGGFYRIGHFPNTAQRMAKYQSEAPAFACAAVEQLHLGEQRKQVTHLIVTSCTGFFAPGVDFEIMRRCGLNENIERTIVGFMGCNAAINALRLARHIVRSAPEARVLVVSIELCTLHLQEADDIDQLLSFLLFGDGCAAALISSERAGLSLDSFHSGVAPLSSDQITWTISDQGFDMVLSGRVPRTIAAMLRENAADLLSGAHPSTIDLWAIHPGGRSVLDSVGDAFDLRAGALDFSRDILRNYGNMSSATVLFILEAMMRSGQNGARGCAMAFGPGLSAETMLFRVAT